MFGIPAPTSYYNTFPRREGLDKAKQQFVLAYGIFGASKVV